MSKKKNIQPNWRPNFRIPDTLPDIKVVRTDFVVNFVAVTLALLASIFVFQREYRAHVLKNSIAKLEQEIRVAEPEDAVSLKLSQRFRDAAEHVVELEKFYNSAVAAHDLLAELAEAQPADLIFNQITYSENVRKADGGNSMEYGIQLAGQVRELTVLDGFKETLSKTSFYDQARFTGEIDETVQSRDSETLIFPYRINITLRPAAAKTEGGKS